MSDDARTPHIPLPLRLYAQGGPSERFDLRAQPSPLALEEPAEDQTPPRLTEEAPEPRPHPGDEEVRDDEVEASVAAKSIERPAEERPCEVVPARVARGVPAGHEIDVERDRARRPHTRCPECEDSGPRAVVEDRLTRAELVEQQPEGEARRSVLARPEGPLGINHELGRPLRGAPGGPDPERPDPARREASTPVLLPIGVGHRLGPVDADPPACIGELREPYAWVLRLEERMETRG